MINFIIQPTLMPSLFHNNELELMHGCEGQKGEKGEDLKKTKASSSSQPPAAGIKSRNHGVEPFHLAATIREPGDAITDHRSANTISRIQQEGEDLD